MRQTKKALRQREREELIEETLKAIRYGKYSSVREASRATGLSKTTLLGRQHGRKPRNKAHERLQILSHMEEKELARWVTMCTIDGHHLTHDIIRTMAEGIIRKRRVKGGNDNKVDILQYGPIGKEWVNRFLKRHPYLETANAKRGQVARTEVSVEEMENWCERFAKVMKECGVLPENVSNMDEPGFDVGRDEERNAVTGSNVEAPCQAQPVMQEWVLPLECISADQKKKSTCTVHFLSY